MILTVTLQAADAGCSVAGFVIAGEDRRWVKANARIDGEKVIVSHPGVKAAVAVRYAWAWNQDCNLCNGTGLPASPFRTDDWNDFTYLDLAPVVIPPTFGPATFQPVSSGTGR